MILLPHFDIPYGFGLGKIPCNLPFQGPVFFDLPEKENVNIPHPTLIVDTLYLSCCHT